MKWKEFAEDYLRFTRKDRIAILSLLLLIVVVFLLPQFFSSPGGPGPANTDTAWISALKKLELNDSLAGKRNPYATSREDEAIESGYGRSKRINPASAKGILFYFDPNTLTAEGWKLLGLRDKTIGTILKFRSKGGRFRKPEDLQKIYGLFPDEYERLAPFVSIANQQTLIIETDPDADEKKPVKTFTPRYSVIDINLADTSAFISLPGIGSKLAVRIVNFRDKLGGFHSIDQVAETFGLPDSTFQMIRQYLKLENNTVKKLNINTASEDELKAHPYIRFGLARPIVAYRKEKGPFTKLHDLLKVMAVTEESFNKMAPYLTL